MDGQRPKYAGFSRAENRLIAAALEAEGLASECTLTTGTRFAGVELDLLEVIVAGLSDYSDTEEGELLIAEADAAVQAQVAR